MRIRHVLVAVSFAGAAALSAAGCASHARPAGSVTAEQQFEKLKTLAGTWVAAPSSGMKGSVVYRVVAAGSAVEETVFPKSEHEMVTMYHLDGGELVLTHYCALGNQPAMRAAPANDLSSIRFAFVRLGNGDASKDMHMHEGVLTFGDDGHLRSKWSAWENGKPGEFQAEFDLVRAD